MTSQAHSAPGSLRRDLPWLVVIIVVVAVIWGPTFSWMVDRWSEDGGYYLHGFAIPPAATWLAWQRRHEAQWGSGGGAGAGLALIVLGGLAQVPSALLEIHFTSACGLLLVVAGLVLAGGGRAAFKAWLPALLLAGFMVPLPLAAVASANLELKLLAAGTALELARSLGVIVVRDGASLVLTGGDVLVVGTVCSGLRFLVSLTALGAFIALASRLPARRRAILFALSVPVAFACNVLRILALVVVADHWGAGATTGWIHDVSGWLLFAAALAAVFGLETLLGRGLPAGAPPESSTGTVI